MVKFDKIKMDIKDITGSLSNDELAELYFKERKKYIKLNFKGLKSKALMALKVVKRFIRMAIGRILIFFMILIINLFIGQLITCFFSSFRR